MPARPITATTRRSVLLGGLALAATGCVTEVPTESDWTAHFATLDKGAVLVDLSARRLSYWSAGNRAYREFPVGVPSAPELERRGTTRVVSKRRNPTWAPTPSMLRRNPALPRFVPAGPDNPLGLYALYLSWQYYAIHGTNDPRTIGRATTSGCIRLFDTHIAWLFEACEIGTPVVIV